MQDRSTFHGYTVNDKVSKKTQQTNFKIFIKSKIKTFFSDGWFKSWLELVFKNTFTETRQPWEAEWLELILRNLKSKKTIILKVWSFTTEVKSRSTTDLMGQTQNALKSLGHVTPS